jgi:putative transposase
VSGVVVKRAYRYRCHPTDQQAVELSRTFGCVRLVYNRALDVRTSAWRQEQRRVGYADTSALLTGWKRTEELAFLNEVSSVPLQQCLRHQQKAFTNFFGKRAAYPRFKSRKKSRASAEYTRSGFRWRDLLHKLTTRLVRENQTIVIEDLAVRNMVRNRALARAISDASWSEFRSLLTYKAEWYGRTVVVVDRWFPSSKTCSRCGHLLDTLPLGVREWTCPGCGEVHDRDVNAARNILAAGRAVAACGDGVRPNRR